MAGALGAHIFQSSAQGGNDGGQSAQQSDQPGSGDGTCAHRADVTAPDVIRGHERDGNGGGIDGRVAGKLPVKLDGGHHHQP